jgi:DNA-binding transcriptional regulator YiaG
MNTGGRFTAACSGWHRVRRMYERRELRRSPALGQREFAALLDVPLETLRTWNSGRQPTPASVLHRATVSVADYKQRSALLPLCELAKEPGVHIRTLHAAARTWRFQTHFSIRSVFGRPMRFSSRAAGEQFLATHHRRFSGQPVCPLPLPTVPDNYDERLRGRRQRMRLTQDTLARRIGAAGKAVVYQWESRNGRRHPCCGNASLRLDGLGPRVRSRIHARSSSRHEESHTPGLV